MPQETLIRLRLTARDARAETGQVDTTRLLELFQDAATELCIRQVGDEGILRTYTTVEFLGPLRVGDYVEVRGRLADQGRKTCTIDLVAHKVVRAARTLAAPLAGEALDPPRLIARASGVWLVPERVPVETAAEAAADVETLDEDIATMPAEGAGEAAEGQTEPMSWGGHRPGDRPAPRRRPGPDVRLREEEAETPPPRREREERGGEWERRPAEERREWRPREERDRSGGQRRWEDRQPRREGQERGRDERPRGRDEGGRGRDERRGEDRPPRDRSYGDRPRGGGSDRSASDRPRGDRPYGDRPRGGGSDRSASDRPRGDRPYGDRPRGSGDRPYGDRSRGAEERARGGDRPGSGPRRRRE